MLEDSIKMIEIYMELFKNISWNYSILFACSSFESQPLNKFIAAMHSVISWLGQSVLMLPHLRGFKEKYWEILL